MTRQQHRLVPVIAPLFGDKAVAYNFDGHLLTGPAARRVARATIADVLEANEVVNSRTGLTMNAAGLQVARREAKRIGNYVEHFETMAAKSAALKADAKAMAEIRKALGFAK